MRNGTTLWEKRHVSTSGGHEALAASGPEAQ
jgi:hypothetical protein